MPDSDFNREIDDILKNHEDRKSRRRLNSGKKGHRGEHGACKILTERFQKPFERAIGSGNRWSQVKSLPQHAKDTLLGDICAPEGFRWVIECKNGYEDKVDFYSLFKGGNRTLDDFIKQAEAESERAGKFPLILYKRSRRPWLAMVQTSRLEGSYEFQLVYRNWSIVNFEALLSLPDSFFFKN